jgi:hypothetical protein
VIRRTLFLAAALAFGPRLALAQDLEPRLYTNTPIGMNFVLAGYAYQDGDVVTDASVPLENAKVKVHNAVVAYARSFAFLGTSAKADVVVPYGWADGSATLGETFHERIVQGFADPRLRVSVNLFGAPALTLEEFAGYEQDLIIGASFSMWPPLGQYDGDKLLNIGSNRWAFKYELGFSKTFDRLTIEVAPSVALFTDNHDFFGGMTREQDPIYAVQSHLVYRFHPAFWASLDGTYYGGGASTVDDVDNDDRQSNSRMGLTLSLSVTRRHSIKLYASKGLTTRIGGDFDVIGLAAQYRWGGGV